MGKIVFFLSVAFCLSVNCFASETHVTYNGKTFTISTYNENIAIKEIANARKVYAFVVSEVALNTGNASDFSNTFINYSTGEYAIEVEVNDKRKNYTLNCYVIFSLESARIESILPEGFETTMTEVGYAGSDTSQAGYCLADNEGIRNSYIVYVKK